MGANAKRRRERKAAEHAARYGTPAEIRRRDAERLMLDTLAGKAGTTRQERRAHRVRVRPMR